MNDTCIAANRTIADRFKMSETLKILKERFNNLVVCGVSDGVVDGSDYDYCL